VRLHALKLEKSAWLEGSSCVCDQASGDDECYVQNEVHTLFILPRP